MLGVEIGNYGWNFIIQNIKNFINENAVWGIALVIIILLFFGGNKEEKLIFVYPMAIYLVTVCNPILIKFMGNFIGLGDRYYRFFWLIPFVPLMGIGTVLLINKIDIRGLRFSVYFIVIFLVISLGKAMYTETDSPIYHKSNSPYYIDKSVIQISELLHSTGIKNPKVLYDSNLLYLLRQYDPSIVSVLSRADAETIWSYFENSNAIEIREGTDYFQMLKWAYLASYKIMIPQELFEVALEEEKVHFIISREHSEDAINYYLIAGCEMMGEINGYIIYDTGIDP